MKVGLSHCWGQERHCGEKWITFLSLYLSFTVFPAVHGFQGAADKLASLV